MNTIARSNRPETKRGFAYQTSRLLASLLGCVGVSATAPAAVFGTDQRTALSTGYDRLADYVGSLIATDTGAMCSAFCVAHDVIATAGHCVNGTSVSIKPGLTSLRFMRASDRTHRATAIKGRKTATQNQNVLTSGQRLRLEPPINAADDWAVIKLETPVCTAGGLPLSTLTRDEVMAATAKGQLYQIASHRDLPDFQPRLASACELSQAHRSNVGHPPDAGDAMATASRDFADWSAILFHDCDTGGGSSGSPLLVDGRQGSEVIGINVGTYVLSRSIPTASSATASRLQPVANTAIDVSRIADAVATLRAREILSEPDSVRQVQSALHRMNLFSGGIDGRSSAALEGAIKAFEQRRGRGVTGLLTQALLNDLNAIARAATPARSMPIKHLASGAHRAFPVPAR